MGLRRHPTHQVLQAKKGDDKKARQARADRWVKVEGEGENEPDYKIATEAVELLEKKHDKPFFIAVDSTSRTCRSSRRNTSTFTIPQRMELPPDFAPRVTGKGPAFRPNFDLFIRSRCAAAAGARGRSPPISRPFPLWMRKWAACWLPWISMACARTRSSRCSATTAIR